MNKHNLQELFNNGEPHDLTTTVLKTEIPLFYDKLGADKPLAFDISYRDMKFEFKR